VSLWLILLLLKEDPAWVFGISDILPENKDQEVDMEIIVALAAGLILAGVINYASDVLPVHRRLKRVDCPHCQAQFPVGRYLLLQPCATCGTKRTRRAWVVQIGFPLVVLGMWLFPPGRLGFWGGSGLLAYFAVVAVIDLEHRLVLHPVSWLGAAVGLLIGLSRLSLLDTLAGGALGFGVMLGLYFFGVLFNRVMARLRNQEIDEVALGFGDVNLAGIIGLMLGWQEVIGALLIAILLGGLVSGLLMAGMALLRRYNPLTAIPYAPFLLIGAIIFLYLPKN
jgi:leader peptidase (prepilin peptidase)/N-methyltransferase